MKLSSAVVRRVACILSFPLLWSCCSVHLIQNRYLLFNIFYMYSKDRRRGEEQTINEVVAVVHVVLVSASAVLPVFRMDSAFYFFGNSVQFCCIPYPRHDDDLTKVNEMRNQCQGTFSAHALCTYFYRYYYDYILFWVVWGPIRRHLKDFRGYFELFEYFVILFDGSNWRVFSIYCILKIF